MVAYERTPWGYTWNFETLVDHVKEAGYKTKSEWRRGNQSSIQAAKKWGVLDAVMAECGLTDTRKKHVGKWNSADTIIAELRRLGVKTLNDWIVKSHGSKDAAARHGWTEQIQDALGIKRQHVTAYLDLDDVVELSKIATEIDESTPAVARAWLELYRKHAANEPWHGVERRM